MPLVAKSRQFFNCLSQLCYVSMSIVLGHVFIGVTEQSFLLKLGDTSGVEFCRKCVAAPVRGCGVRTDLRHQWSKSLCPVPRRRDGGAIVTTHNGAAALCQPSVQIWLDLRVNRDNAVFPGCGFNPALKIVFICVVRKAGQFQKFSDTESCVT